MKKKLLFLACAAMMSVGAMAQSVGEIITVGAAKYKVLGENIIKNGDFEDGMNNWTCKAFTEPMGDGFELRQEDGNNYLVGTQNAGGGDAKSISTAWEIETGKTYYYAYNILRLGSGTDTQYLKTSLTSEVNKETSPLTKPELGATGEWKLNEWVFSNTEYTNLQANFRWLNGQWGFDDFKLMEVQEVSVDDTELQNLIQNVNDFVLSTEGDQTDIEKALNEASTASISTKADLDAAIKALKEAYDEYYFNKALPTMGETLDYTAKLPAFNNAANWTYTTGAQNHVWKNSTEKNDGEYVATGFYENWNQNPYEGKISLKAAGLREGYYRISALAFNNVAEGTVSFFAGSESVELSNATTMLQPVSIDNVIVLGDLELGLQVAATNWVGITNVKLEFLGEIPADTKENAEIEKIINEIKEAGEAYVIPADENIGDDALLYNSKYINVAKSAKERYTGKTMEEMKAQLLTDINVQMGMLGLPTQPKLTADICKALRTQVFDAMEIAEELNAPTADDKFNLVITFPGWEHSDKAVTYIANGRSDAGLYNMQYLTAVNANYPQAFTLTPVAGMVNTYLLSQIDADGEERFVCTGVVYGGSAVQLRTTLEQDKALQVELRLDRERAGIYHLWNTEANQFIGGQDAGFFTVNSHIDFNITPAVQIPGISITEAGYATYVAPVKVEIPAGVTAYTAVSVEDGELVLSEVTSDYIHADDPVIVQGEAQTGEGQGYANQLPLASSTSFLLTGVYDLTTVEAGNYLLQQQDGKTGFYKIAAEDGLKLAPNHAYLTAFSEAKAFMLGQETAIKAISGLTAGKAIYDLNGRQLEKLQKGVNIVNGVKVIVK